MTLRHESRASRAVDRGASLVEYALLMGLFAAAATGGIKVINKEAGEKVESVSDNVGELPDVEGSVPE